MKYLIMECHDSYAIALDEEGKFIVLANLNYQVGEKVDLVYPMQSFENESFLETEEAVVSKIQDELDPKKTDNQRKTSFRKIASVMGLAAVLFLVFTILFRINNRSIGSVYLIINPEVRIDINHKDQVTKLEGVNEDGKELIEGYDYKRKDVSLVIDELIELAIEKGYLYDHGKLKLKFDANNKDWQKSTRLKLNKHFMEEVARDIKFVIDLNDDDLELEVQEDGITKTKTDYQIKIPIKK